MINYMTKYRTLRADKQSGFSLVEVMVGLLIGLLGTIVIFQVFSISEGQKRTTTSGNDANQSGVFALYTLERHLRMGGGGLINEKNTMGCLIRASFNGAVVLPAAAAFPAPFATLNGQLRAAPLLIQDGGGSNPDNVVVMYGNSALAGVAIDMTAFGDSVSVPNTVGFATGDIVLASTPFKTTLFEPPGDCFIGQMTNAPGPAVETIELTPAANNYNSAGGITSTGYPFDGINLGQAGFLGFGISSTAADRFELVSYDFLTAGPVTAIADNIVNLQALYGVDDGSGGKTAEDSIIDAWVPATGTWSYAALTDGSFNASAKLRRIKAVRLALVARSALPEKREG
ncbi:MAG: PilW family protein, partial [Burkholderiales bacterium]